MMEPPLSELDTGFEPQQRARSNTWPLPRPDNFVEIKEEPKCPGSVLGAGTGVVLPCGTVMGPDGTLQTGLQLPTTAKKNSSRRNAWGNLSYADLITQAITSAPEKRLTLSQIYEWMVQNVPYFKDKGDSNSSAGWKNSIRHNLSLHNRFMRVQNEGTGKSSWWMINPDAKPGKSARRRATSMETSKFEKRRGRVKKKVEALRNGLQPPLDATPSPSSSISEGLDLFPDSPRLSFQQLSPDFRPRASSNASSCGRLSPIPAVLGVEPDWGTPSPFSGPTGLDQSGLFILQKYCISAGHRFPANFIRYRGALSLSTSAGYGPEQLAGSLAERMKIHQSAEFMAGYNGGGGGNNGQQSSQQTQPPPPPPYQTTYDFGTQQQQQPDLSALHAASPYGLSQCPIHRLQPCSCHHLQQPQQPPPQHSPVAGMSPSYPQSEPSPDPATQFATVGSRSSSNSPPDTPTPSTMMGQLMGALNNSALLDDLNLNIETLHGGFDCNVDEVIKHELSMDGSLDFNFSQHHHHHHHHLHHHHHPGHHQLGATVPGATQELQQGVVPQQPAAAAAAPYTTTVSTGPSWVH